MNDELVIAEVTVIEHVPFTQADRDAIQRIDETLTGICNTIAALLPMLDGLKDSPIGKMLGL